MLYWWELMEQAGAAGISEAEYWECSPRYVWARIRAQRETQQFQYEATWEQARLVAWAAMVAPHNDPKHLPKTPVDLMRFQWEGGQAGRRPNDLDDDTRAVLMARLDEEAAKFFGTAAN